MCVNRMAGTNLMCIWHATYIKDGGKQSTSMKQETLKAVSSYVFTSSGVPFSSEEFVSRFPPNEMPDFASFSSYIRSLLIGKVTNYDELRAKIEKICWSMCVMAYQPRMLYFEEDKEQLWQVNMIKIYKYRYSKIYY